MADPKDTTSFFRKVVKFVANPATEWNDLGPPSQEARETEYAKSELKAMIERKRRNDFVRKREFDMLRKVRREGLTAEQVAALGGSSRLEDSEGKLEQRGARAETGVKAKIDEIEQQMVGDAYPTTPQRRPPPDFYNAPTRPAPMDERPTPARRSGAGALMPPEPLSAGAVEHVSAAASPATAVMGPGMSPLSPMALEAVADFSQVFPVEGSDVPHDPELDEAVIAFANADFEGCEQSIAALTGPGGARADHAETWLVLFDLYRAIGQQQKFESLALDYAQQFGWSAPQWFSMPRLVAEAAEEAPRSREAAPTAPGAMLGAQVGWACPAYLDAEAVARLRSQSLQMPLPWVFDWSDLKGVDTEAAARLSELFRHWIVQKLEMRWLGGESLLATLAEAAPTGVRDVDPAYWQLRLDALRMVNRPDQFDEAAIDYCVTYEVSPPSWEPATCRVKIANRDTSSTLSPAMSLVGEVSTSFPESTQIDPTAVASVELSGQLVGDISTTLARMNIQLGSNEIISIACSRLIRVDFIAAGDLLNWVLARRAESRHVTFVDAHRLVALFFGAMGITEHARVKVSTV